MINKTKEFLIFIFEMKDMGEVAYVFGKRISIEINSNILYSNQENILKRNRKNLVWKIVNPHVCRGHNLNKSMWPKYEEEISEMFKVFYAQVVGSLMYKMISIRSYIYHMVGLISKYQSNPGK